MNVLPHTTLTCPLVSPFHHPAHAYPAHPHAFSQTRSMRYRCPVCDFDLPLQTPVSIYYDYWNTQKRPETTN